MTYKLIGGIGTRRRVAFACPVCGAELQAPLSDAGRVYPCPTCSREFVVPGADVLRQEAASAAALAAQQRDAAALTSEALPFAIPEPDDDPATQAAATRLEYAGSGRPVASEDQGGATPPPDYRQLVAAARAVIVFAYLAFGLGVFGLVIAGGAYVIGLTRGAFDRAAATALALGLLPPSLSLVCAGSLLYLFAHVGMAVRDIARNSFRQ